MGHPGDRDGFAVVNPRSQKRDLGHPGEKREVRAIIRCEAGFRMGSHPNRASLERCAVRMGHPGDRDGFAVADPRSQKRDLGHPGRKARGSSYPTLIAHRWSAARLRMGHPGDRDGFAVVNPRSQKRDLGHPVWSLSEPTLAAKTKTRCPEGTQVGHSA